MSIKRSEIIRRFNKNVEMGMPIIGAGAGIGISAKCAEVGGADLIVVYNSGKYRMGGRGSLAGFMPYDDANSVVVEMANEVLTIVKDTPVFAGVCGTDPFKKMDLFLEKLKNMGFSGVQNFPTVGIFDGRFRKNLEETNLGYYLEVDMIKTAHQMDLYTCPYVFDEEEACMMAEAGADMLVAHMGLTTKGNVGAISTRTLDQCVEIIQNIHNSSKKINEDILVICHGGPISEPDDVAYILKNTKGIAGFFGASSIERLPTEIAIVNQVKEFKNVFENNRPGQGKQEI